MIYVNLFGRLGNNLAQLGAAATLSKRLNTPFVAVPQKDCWCPAPDNCYYPEYLEPLKKNIFRKVQFTDCVPEGCQVVTGGISSWDDVDFSAGCDIEMRGVFLSTQLIDRDVCRELFSLSAEMNQALIDIFHLTSETGTIGIRRGDYMKLPHHFAICGKSYFINAMRRMEKLYGVKHWLVISEDVEWCEKVFKNIPSCRVLKNETVEGLMLPGANVTILRDFYLQTLCNYLIISNSSFSWWGGYLNVNKEPKMIYPTPWFGISSRKLYEAGVRDRYANLPGMEAMPNRNPYQRMRGWMYALWDIFIKCRSCILRFLKRVYCKLFRRSAKR